MTDPDDGSPLLQANTPRPPRMANINMWYYYCQT